MGDLCRAILLALESDVAGEVFQIATGVETSIQELVRVVQRVAGREPEVRHGPLRRGDIRKNYSGVRKARAILGWKARMKLEDGLEKTWGWFAGDVPDRWIG